MSKMFTTSVVTALVVKKQYRYLSTVSGRCTEGMNMKRQLRSGFDVADNKALQGIG